LVSDGTGGARPRVRIIDMRQLTRQGPEGRNEAVLLLVGLLRVKLGRAHDEAAVFRLQTWPLWN
jgi:hypothetical protein